jgi:cell division septation protein DedD
MRSPQTELLKDKIEVSLDGRQIFYLFFGGAVIASLVFVLGVVVGKRVEARSYVERTASSSTTLDPLAALDQLEVTDDDEQLAFAGALAGGADAERQPLGSLDRALAPADEDEAQGADEAEGDGDDAHASAAKSEKKPEDKAEKKPEPVAADDEADKASAEKAKPAAADADDKDEEKTSAAEAKFTLQLSSFQNRAEADSLYADLQAAGYSPYIVEANVPDKGGIWYRVRLGRYPDYDAAIDAKAKFEDDQHIIAYVTRL